MKKSRRKRLLEQQQSLLKNSTNHNLKMTMRHLKILSLILLLSLSLFLQIESSENIDETRFQSAHNHLFQGLECEREKEWKGPFFFIQMADCQLGFFEDNKSWDQEIALLDKAVDHINRLHPKFVVLCGDLTHAYPREPMHDQQVIDFKKAVSKIDKDIPLVCLCGNHDIGNCPDRSTIAIYEADFGSHYLSFWVGGVQSIVLNSTLIWDPSNAQDLYEEQLDWFKKQLQVRIDGKAPVHRIVFAHHPWFINAFDEDDWYFVMPKARRIPFLNLMKDAKVSVCFCGHYHRNALADYEGMPVITTSAIGKQLGSDVSGFRIVKVFDEDIEHEYFSLEDMPKSISLQ